MPNKDLNLNEFLKEVSISPKTFYRYMNELCAIYGFDRWKFKVAGESKEDLYKNDNNYIFKKEWNHLAIALFKIYNINPYYTSSKNPSNISLDEIYNFNKKAIDIIDQLEPLEKKYELQLHPTYLNTITENKSLSLVQQKFSLLLRVLGTLPIESRCILWTNLDSIINDLIIQLYLKSFEIKEYIEMEKGELFKEFLYGEFEYNNIMDYLAESLKREMNSNFIERKNIFSKNYYEAESEVDNLLREVLKESSDGDRFDDEENIINRCHNEIIKPLLDNEKAKEVKNKIKYASEIASKSKSLTDYLEDYIKNEKRKNSVNKPILNRLEGLQEILAEIERESSFNEVAKKTLTELNSKIMKNN